MLKDQSKLYENYESFNIKCPICLKATHLNDKCPIVHYIPNKDILIKKLNYSTFHDRKRNLHLTTRKKYNARSNFSVVQFRLLKHMIKNEEDGSNSEDEICNTVFNGLSLQQKMTSIESNLKKIPIETMKLEENENEQHVF